MLPKRAPILHFSCAGELNAILPYCAFYNTWCVSGLKASTGSSEDWTQKLMRVKLEALVRSGTEQSADEALGILSQVQYWL